MRECLLRGVSAAPGMATGRAMVLGQPAAFDTRPIPEADRAAEVIKARAALTAAADELESIAGTLRSGGRPAEAEIVETGILMAQDPTLGDEIERQVVERGLIAAVALREAAEVSAGALANLDDPMLAERADDVRSLGRRAAAHAAGARGGRTTGVLIADSLGPADVAELSGVEGVALAGGGVTAHAAIVARSLGLPMVVGFGPAIFEIADGEEVVLDGDGGLLVRFPARGRLAKSRNVVAGRRRAREHAVEHRNDPAITKDGRRIRILANAASVAEAHEALAQGAEGVGLLRTELLFLDAPDWPSEAQQLRFLKPILTELAGLTATVRLLDFGGDKTPPFLRGANERGVELLLQAPQALRAQLSAIVKAGSETRLRILIPMVSQADQVRAVRAALADVLDGRPSPELGAMIETPEAARMAAEIAKEVDFFSIGTNDLTQLVLGLDREQSKTAPVTDVRVLRLIDTTMRAGREAAIPVDVCGEAASDATAMPIMVGLGADELSVGAARVGEVRERVQTLSFDDCETLSAEALLGKVADAGRKGV
jgi:phosphoenolpyruvate-protein phosphotransferase